MRDEISATASERNAWRGRMPWVLYAGQIWQAELRLYQGSGSAEDYLVIRRLGDPQGSCFRRIVVARRETGLAALFPRKA